MLASPALISTQVPPRNGSIFEGPVDMHASFALVCNHISPRCGSFSRPALSRCGLRRLLESSDMLELPLYGMTTYHTKAASLSTSLGYKVYVGSVISLNLIAPEARVKSVPPYVLGSRVAHIEYDASGIHDGWVAIVRYTVLSSTHKLVVIEWNTARRRSSQKRICIGQVMSSMFLAYTLQY